MGEVRNVFDELLDNLDDFTHRNFYDKKEQKINKAIASLGKIIKKEKPHKNSASSDFMLGAHWAISKVIAKLLE